MGIEEVEFPCPFCGTVNRIDEHLVPPSGEVRCGSCSETVSLRPASVVDPGMGIGGPGLNESGPIAPPDLGGGPTGPEAGEGGDVCCPRCGHRFDPDEARAPQTTVLVVEDTDFFLQLAADVLASRFSVITARTVAEARQALATSPVHLVILDLTLPDGEGTEVLRALPRRDIPVLIYTSRDETSLIGPEWELLTSLGARDVLHKGINIEDALLAKTVELLEGGAPSA